MKVHNCLCFKVCCEFFQTLQLALKPIKANLVLEKGFKRSTSYSLLIASIVDDRIVGITDDEQPSSVIMALEFWTYVIKVMKFLCCRVLMLEH